MSEENDKFLWSIGKKVASHTEANLPIMESVRLKGIE